MNSQQNNPAALDKAYKYITSVVIKQQKFIPFDLIYGDGTIYQPLTRATVELMYNTMQEMIKEEPQKYNALNTLL
jgi:hypothetical protein